MIVSLNGQLRSAADAAIPIDDPGFLSADGVFETVLVHDGGFFRFRPHLERFAASAAMLRLPAPDLDEVERLTREVVRENGLARANVRMTLTRGSRAPTLLITARPPDPGWVDRARGGWKIVTASTRRPSTAALPAQLKALGRTWALLARHEAADARADDALLLNDAGHVCEGPAWNVFWRAGDTIFTPSIDAGVLAGITRAVLFEVAPAAGFAIRDGLWQRRALERADEIFATMTSVGIVPFRALDSRALSAETPAAGALLEKYWNVVRRDTAADPV